MLQYAHSWRRAEKGQTEEWPHCPPERGVSVPHVGTGGIQVGTDFPGTFLHTQLLLVVSLLALLLLEHR